MFSSEVSLVYRYSNVFHSNIYMTKVQVNKNIFYFELGGKSNFDIVGIPVSMWGKHAFETIFTSKDVIDIQDVIVNVLGSREIV